MIRLLKDLYHKTQRHTIRGLVRLSYPTPRLLDISEMKKVVVIAPHPDDEVFGCGGLMMRLINSGKKLNVIFLSRGEGIAEEGKEAEIIVEKRRTLTLQALSIIGLTDTDISWLNFPDSKFSEVSEEEINKLAQIVESIDPDTVFFPHHKENSPDHDFASQVVRNLIINNGYAGYEYCVWVWYHMPLIQAFKLKYKNSRLLPVIDCNLKRKMIRIYSEAKDGNGLYYSGVLPKEFLNAVSWNKELFFKI